MVKQRELTKAQIEKVAHHEAGHAVAKYLLGVKFDYVTIVQKGDCAGYIKEPKVFLPSKGSIAEGKTWSFLYAHVVSLPAGTEAVRRHAGKHARTGDEHDKREAARLTRWACGEAGGADALLRFFRQRAEAFVQEHGAEIGAVAAALLARRKLTYKEVGGVLQDHHKKLTERNESERETSPETDEERD